MNYLNLYYQITLATQNEKIAKDYLATAGWQNM